MVAYVRGSLTDRAIMIVSTVALSICFLVYIIVGQYAVRLPARLVPGAGLERELLEEPRHLRAAAGDARGVRRPGAASCACTARFFLDEIDHDYVRTARAKGMTEKTVMLKHVLRNAMIPILTNVGIALPGIFVGSFLIEVFFSIPGLGPRDHRWR